MATDIAGHPVMCLSALARHSVNLRNDAVASLLVNEERGGDPLAEARITVLGRVEALEDQNAAQRFLARHPAARVYVGFADFAFYRLVPTEGHLVAGFGRIRDVAADELVLTGQHLHAISLTEEGAVTHVNTDHAGFATDAATAFARRGARPLAR
jgi:putative heme iron utilization protein